MKYFKLFVLVFCIFSTANAQFKFGVGGGVNFANFSGSDISNVTGVTGFNGGLMTEVKLPVKLGFEMDILFSTKGTGNLPLVNDVGDQIGDGKMKMSYIDIPILVKIYMLKVISLQLGPQYSMLMSAKMESIDFKNLYESGDVSAVVGFGIDVSKLHISCRYNYGLSSIVDGADVKNNMLTLTLGLWLKK